MVNIRSFLHSDDISDMVTCVWRACGSQWYGGQYQGEKLLTKGPESIMTRSMSANYMSYSIYIFLVSFVIYIRLYIYIVTRLLLNVHVGVLFMLCEVCHLVSSKSEQYSSLTWLKTPNTEIHCGGILCWSSMIIIIIFLLISDLIKSSWS